MNYRHEINVGVTNLRTPEFTLTIGMNSINFNKQILKSLVERPIIALQTTTRTKMSKQSQGQRQTLKLAVCNL